jgi:hypothetical protein
MEIIKNNPTWVALAEKLYETKAKIKYLEEIEAELSKTLLAESNFEDTSIAGYTYKKVERPGSVDYSKIPQLKDVDLNPFRKESVIFWKLSFVKQFDI